MADKYYDLHVAGVTRRLRVLKVSDSLAIAGFILLGDVELTSACAAELIKKFPPGVEEIMTAETKGIPLAAEVARQMGLDHYIVARKSVKAYMKNPLCVEDESITTLGRQMLCLMDTDVLKINGKRTLLLDDVISRGGSILAMQHLAERAGAKVIGKAAVLAEGDAAKRTDIIFLEHLPLFKPE